MAVAVRRTRAPTITAEKRERRRAYERATHSLRIEGLTMSPEAEAIAQAWLRGDISGEERMAQVKALHGT